MIAFVEGDVRFVRPDSVLVDTGGIGYEIFTPNASAAPLGQRAFFYTYEQVSDDARLLYGFSRETDYQVFLQLLKVRGIGPRSALNILKTVPGTKIVEAVEAGDLKALKALPGIGAKTASQMVLDLKGRLVTVKEPQESQSTDPAWTETDAALEALGYSPKERKAIRQELEHSGLPVDVMLRSALNLLAKRKGVK